MPEQESERLFPEESELLRRRVDASFDRDPERWRLSYLEQTATKIRWRVLERLAIRNGRA